MTDSIRPSTPATVNRRRLLRAAALVPAVPLAAALPATATSPASASAPGLHPTDPLPPAGAEFRSYIEDNITVGTIGELLGAMQAEASINTHWTGLDADRIAAKNAYLHVWGADAITDIYRITAAYDRALVAREEQSFALGYAIAMMHDQAVYGPETWYRAARGYAGITELSEAEQEVVDTRYQAIVDENWALLGYERIPDAERAGPDLVRLAGYVPRSDAAEEVSS